MYKLRDYQKAAVEAVYNHLRTKDNNPCAVLPTGCHAKGHPILMFDGTMKPVEDISVGDVLMGADSTPRHVLALCRGRDMMYKITPKRGEEFVVNGGHVLSLVKAGAGNRRTIVNISVDDWQKQPRQWKRSTMLYKAKVFGDSRHDSSFCRMEFTVEPVGVDDYYGFVLDGDHLYVDGNFMVHHNSGKSICIAQVAKDATTKWNGKVMILAHVKELVEQNAAKLCAICPELKVGVYSAGLGSRDTGAPVIVAGIQSVFNKAEQFGKQDLIIIDEVHAVPNEGLGRYRTFLEAEKRLNPRVRLIGFTATPYRTQGGLICKPENLLNEICYEIGVKELINRGYISRITARAGKHSANTDDLHVRMGEFVAEDVERVMGESGLVSSACREIVEYAKDRQACLIFCTSVAHCNKVARLIAEYSGEECAVVTGDTPADEREETIRRLRGETVKSDLFNDKPPLRYCCNVSVLTTGTDIPRLDTIALLRPTMSPGLLVQMVGRGFRLSPETGKREALILDYGRNIERHGPIDMINVKEKSSAKGEPLAKTCPKCNRIVNLSTMLCPECGYQWPRKEREETPHEATAANTGILSGEVTIEEFPVMHTTYSVWTKRGAPPDAPKTVRVTYDIDYLRSHSEWLCPEHTGYARRKFEKWWREHARPECPMPQTAADVCEFEFMGMLRQVKSIKVKFTAGQKYPEIIGCELGDFPDPQTESQEEDIDYEDVPF